MDRRRTARRSLVAAAGMSLGLTAGCSASNPDSALAVSSSAAAALSSAAVASPGEYGSPVDPDLPNPTDVATDHSTPGSGASTVPVVVTYLSWVADTGSVEAGAYVPDLVESGGTCTLTLIGVAGSVTASGSAEANGDTTSCPALSLGGDTLSPGRYSAVIHYESVAVTGDSDVASVVVP